MYLSKNNLRYYDNKLIVTPIVVLENYYVFVDSNQVFKILGILRPILIGVKLERLRINLASLLFKVDRLH